MIFRRQNPSIRPDESVAALDSEPEGPYMNEPLAAEEWIAAYQRELEEVEQRNQARQNRFDGVEELENW